MWCTGPLDMVYTSQLWAVQAVMGCAAYLWCVLVLSVVRTPISYTYTHTWQAGSVGHITFQVDIPLF